MNKSMTDEVKYYEMKQRSLVNIGYIGPEQA